MKIGIAAATYFEIQPTIDYLRAQQFLAGPNLVDIVITGIGSMLTTYELTKFISKQQPQYMIQAGIGGSFSDAFSPGDVVLVKQEVMGDLGVQEGSNFHDIFDLGFLKSSLFPFEDGILPNIRLMDKTQERYYQANGITVNEITTDPKRIKLLREKYRCEIESMEGAAFHYTCLCENIPFLQLRAVSNVVGERDKTKWVMKPAIEKLNTELLYLLQNLP